MGLFCKSERSFYYFHLLAVITRKIAVKHILKFGFDEPVFFFGSKFSAFVHRCKPVFVVM